MTHRIKELVKEKSLAEDQGIYYLSIPGQKNISLERAYLEARVREKRIFNDDMVRQLPEVSRKNRHYREWIVRKSSAKKLIWYISRKKGMKAILELGSGNGWLSAKLANMKDSFVIGMDINHMEMEQAARVFQSGNLVFVYADIFDDVLSDLKFDFIIVASSLSYFPDAGQLISRLFSLLNEKGEIHFVDNPSYPSGEIPAAKKRTKHYYKLLGVEEMNRHYFHHDLLSVAGEYNFKILYDPLALLNKSLRKLTKSLSPFYWIKIEK